MTLTDQYEVRYPAELFEAWMEEHAMKDGVMQENGKIVILDIKFDGDNRYIIVNGEIERQLDS